MLGSVISVVYILSHGQSNKEENEWTTREAGSREDRMGTDLAYLVVLSANALLPASDSGQGQHAAEAPFWKTSSGPPSTRIKPLEEAPQTVEREVPP